MRDMGRVGRSKPRNSSGISGFATSALVGCVQTSLPRLAPLDSSTEHQVLRITAKFLCAIPHDVVRSSQTHTQKIAETELLVRIGAAVESKVFPFIKIVPLGSRMNK